MRLGALRAAGLAFVCLGLASCAPTKDFISSSHLWPWKQGQGAPGLTADLSKPFPRVARTEVEQSPLQAIERPDEFNAEHPLVEEYVRRFQNEWRGFYGRALERSARYVPRMAEILAREGVPPEIAYLPLIESGFVNTAVSRAGAVGPWQFIGPTGRRRFRRERRPDIVASAHTRVREQGQCSGPPSLHQEEDGHPLDKGKSHPRTPFHNLTALLSDSRLNFGGVRAAFLEE